MNDAEREQWVLNDEGLHAWFVRSRKGMRQFIRENREEIDAAIKRYNDDCEKRRQHHQRGY